MAAPTLIDYAESTWTDSSATVETTDDLNWNASGDVIVVLGATEDNGLAMATPTATGLTLSALSGLPTNTGSSCKVYGWSATAAGDNNSTLVSTNTGSSASRGIAAWSFSGVSALGTPVVNVGSGLTVSVTTVADSTVVMVLADWNATSDVTVDTVPAGGTIRQNNVASGLATYLVVEWTAQAAGTRNYGVSNWTGTGTVSKAAVEVQGVTSTATDANAGDGAGTGTAYGTVIAGGINAGDATSAGVAYGTAVAGGINAGDGAGTGVAYNATVSYAVGANATEAASTGTAYGAGTSATTDAADAASAGVAYNPTVDTGGGGGDPESLFTAWTPTSTNENDGTPLTRALTFYTAVDGEITGIRVFATTTVSTSIETVFLWQITAGEQDPGPGTGTQLGTKVAPGSLTAGQWNDIVFDTPVAVTANTAYKAGSSNDQGRYVAEPGAFLADVTVGNLTAIGATGSGSFPPLGTLRNGTYEYASAGTYPNDFSGTPNYGIDVVFVPDAVVDETDAPATEAAGTGAAYEPVVEVTITATEATSTGTAYAPTAEVTATATEATTAGVAYAPAIEVTITATEATSTGVAYAPTVQTSATGQANPTTAEATGVAYFDAGSLIALELVSDNPLISAGTAYAATVSTAAAGQGNPAEAVAAGVAYAPTVQVSSDGQVTPATAEAAGVAHFDAGSLISLELISDNPVATAGTAYNPTVSLLPIVNADAGTGTAAGGAYNPAVVITIAAGTAVCTAVAPAVSTVIGAPGQVNLADTPAGAGIAYNPRVSKQTPRPNTGVTPRPTAGITYRP